MAAYGLSALAITFVFWRSPQPSADQVTTVASTTTTASTTATGAGTTTTTTTTVILPTALKTAATLDANSAYGISGNAVFTDVATVVIHQFSIIGRGPKVEIQLRDSSDTSLGTLKDISSQTLNQEDLVLAVPSTIDVSQVASLAIVAPDYNLVLSRARWVQ